MNTDDVWHLRVQYKCEQCERTNDFATRRKRYLSLSPVQGGSFFSLKIRDFFSFYFSLPFLRFFRAGLMLAVRFLGNRGGVDGLSASAASRKIE